MIKNSFSVLLCLITSTTFAQQKQLGDEQYFKGNFKSIIQTLPSAAKWTDNAHFIIMREGKQYIMDAKTGIEREANDEDKKSALVPVKPSPYSKNKDLFIKINDVEIQLTNDTLPEINAQASPDGKFIAFTKKNDLYAIDINTKRESRLTTDGSDVILNGYASWVYMEEILGRRTLSRSFWWSPDSKKIAFFRTDESMVPYFTLTDATGKNGYVEKMRYPKVGDKNPEVKVGMVSPEGGSVVWADINDKDDQYFGMPYWKPDGSALLVQWMNRKQDNLKIWEVNPATGSKKEFYNEQQKTWVDLDEDNRIQFYKNGKGFILQSDASGWNQLYNYDINGKLINPITSGKFTAITIHFVDEKNGIVYFSARGRENTARKDVYRVNIDGKKLQRLSSGDFDNTVMSFSPDGSYFISRYGNVGTPDKLALISNTGKLIKELGDSKGTEFNNYQLAKTDFLRVKSDDGLYDLPMKVTWPVNMEKGKLYPVLISIYGGPNAGTAWDTWSLGGNQQFYAKEGLIQVVMDHRASGHFGKGGVNYMYHNLGYWETKDYSTMVKWLIANGQADAKKIAITGYSYGGYMSAYALTYGADVFTHGMAGGSVTDWTLYDTHYAERFMGTPADNPEGYKTSSVLNYVDRYKGMLQIVHGVIDENVHLQNSIQLISKLQDAKKDFEFMMYSGSRHGISGGRAAHYQNLKTKFIYKYLLEKEVPKGMLR